VRETVALLPAAAREVRVQLHPEDAALLRERLATPQAESAWTIHEDPVMSRGGCRVTAEAAQIDARLETRLAAVMTAILGEARAAARSDAAPGDLA
jgi:flagellar assembly protein FliH